MRTQEEWLEPQEAPEPLTANQFITTLLELAAYGTPLAGLVSAEAVERVKRLRGRWGDSDRCDERHRWARRQTAELAKLEDPIRFESLGPEEWQEIVREVFASGDWEDADK